jgi:hypothetical protein
MCGGDVVGFLGNPVFVDERMEVANVRAGNFWVTQFAELRASLHIETEL